MQNIRAKNGSMVLQLVLPSTRPLEPNNNNLTPVDNVFERPNGPKQRSADNQDSYSSYHSSYVNHAFRSNDFGDNFVNGPPSPFEDSVSSKLDGANEKGRAFRKHLANILSSMYALFVVTLGGIIYISDVIIGNSPIAEIFSMMLMIVALIFVLYLITDIRLYMNQKNRQEAYKRQNSDDLELKEMENGDFELNITLPENGGICKVLQHQYCFSNDRHSSNFYLKIGAAGFCIGHLIHSGLLLGYQILFLTSDGSSFYECASVISLILDIIYPIYSFFLLYFIFKYSNVIINRNQAIVRFGLMHCISSSLCFWLWTILRETIEALSVDHSTNDDDDHNETPLPTQLPPHHFLANEPLALPLNSFNKKGANLLVAYLNTSLRVFTGQCHNDAGLTLIYQNYSPYLYPFSVEYSILNTMLYSCLIESLLVFLFIQVGVLFVIWQSVGRCTDAEEVSSKRQCDSREGNTDESNVVIHADCHSANKGLFSGIVVMVLCIVSIILFFIAINDSRYKYGGVLINFSISGFVALTMTVVAVFTSIQLSKLDLSKEHISNLDDLLLFICIPAYFLNGILSIIPAIMYGSVTNIMMVLLEMLQILVQTPLIIDGLRRCSNTKELRRSKPGRELLTYLVVANVALWVTQTFQIKSHTLQEERYEFYGAEMWTIIGHMCIPLMMFYRFHSSVCLADIWKYAYEQSGH